MYRIKHNIVGFIKQLKILDLKMVTLTVFERLTRTILTLKNTRAQIGKIPVTSNLKGWII